MIIFFAAKDGEGLYRQSAKTRPRADCGSDHELLIVKFRLKLKSRKTTRSFKYDLNQIPYVSIVEVTNKFKGLDVIECLKCLMNFFNIVQGEMIKTIPKKKKYKKAKCCLRKPCK